MIKKKLITLSEELELRFNEVLSRWKNHTGQRDQVPFVRLVLECGLSHVERIMLKEDK